MLRRIGLLLFLLLLLAACGNEDDAAPTLASPAEPAGQVTLPPAGSTDAGASTGSPQVVQPTAPPPTPTMPPLAALVNGQPILLADYENELARFEQAQAELGLSVTEGEANYRAIVLEALIEASLLTQAAAANGLVVTPEMVDSRMQELQSEVGGPEDFSAWLQVNQYTEEGFRQALEVEMLTERLVALVTQEVPFAVEQVRARHIQVDDPGLAMSLLEQLQGGADFSLLAQQNSTDRYTAEIGGDLGYFARGTLLVPEVEAAAFALQPGELSGVITVTGVDGQVTYHLVQVVERDPQRPLDGNMRSALLQETFDAWLAEQLAQAEITRFVDTEA